MSDTFSPSGNFGLIWTPVDHFDIGLVGQLPVHAIGWLRWATRQSCTQKGVTCEG